MALAAVTTTGAVFIFRIANQPAELSWLEGSMWSYIKNGTETIGTTASGSYRSAMVIVVAVRGKNGPVKHAMIWRDAVPPEVFSVLHMQLMLTPPSQLH